MTWHPPSLDRVPWSEFPDFHGTMQMLRLPDRRPGALRLHSRPGTTLARGSLPRLAGTRRRGPGILTSGIPDRIKMERPGPPRFLENPDANMPCSQTPMGPARQAITACRCCLPQLSRRRLPQSLSLRGSITRPVRFLCTLRTVRYRTPRNTRFRLLAGLCRVGMVTHWVPVKGFAVEAPPFPGFAWRTRV